jgi:hypothetical protein
MICQEGAFVQSSAAALLTAEIRVYSKSELMTLCRSKTDQAGGGPSAEP